jgi:hypothetical protein
MARQQREERARLESKQQERWEAETRERASRLQSGMKGLWQRVSGEYSRIREQNEFEVYAAVQRDRQQREALIFAQMQERRDFAAPDQGHARAPCCPDAGHSPGLAGLSPDRAESRADLAN